jgi:hypothetical protein
VAVVIITPKIILISASPRRPPRCATKTTPKTITPRRHLQDGHQEASQDGPTRHHQDDPRDGSTKAAPPRRRHQDAQTTSDQRRMLLGDEA